MTDLSPTAQAVLNAYRSRWDFDLATVLRALANQVVPEEDWPDQSIGFADWNLATERCEQRKNIRAAILAIADELEDE